MTIDPRAARIGRAATRDAAIALGRSGVTRQGRCRDLGGRDADDTRRARSPDAAIAKRDAAVAADRTRAGRSDRVVNERTDVAEPQSARCAGAHDARAVRRAAQQLTGALRSRCRARMKRRACRPHLRPGLRRRTWPSRT